MSVEARTEAAPRSRRQRRRSTRLTLRSGLALGLGLLVLVALLVGLAFAGSADKIAAGVRVAGVDVGGLSPAEARARLERRSRALLHMPVVFVADGHRFRVTSNELGVRSDWAAAIAAARREGDGFGPLRGFRRLRLRVFGADVVAPTSVFEGALQREIQQIGQAVDRPRREPAVVLHGTTPAVVRGRLGYVLDRRAAAGTIVRALASFDRSSPVALRVRVDGPRIAGAQLAPAAAQVRRALVAPVWVHIGPTALRIPRWRIAQLLQLPADGRTALRIGGPAATAWLTRLGHRVAQPPRDASFAVDGGTVRIVPGRPGQTIDLHASARALLQAALRPVNRVAHLSVVQAAPKRTTADAKAMGITGLVSSFTTDFTGIPNRIHNVQLVAHLIDGKLIAPGATFSFNQATGARTAAKGFLAAPVIINGEVQTGLGGGVCQVSTTVFNAAFEAGLGITQRTNHALYISHYPQGRDATVDYPDVDLKFVNDTPHWLLLRTFVNSYQLTVSLYGAPQHRRVVSTTTPLVQTASPPVKKKVDPSLAPGQVVVDDSGEPGFRTSVHRLVYDAHGKLLHDDTWYSNYVAAPELVRVGPKKKPAKPAAKTKTTTSPTATTTGPASTTSTPTTTQPQSTTQTTTTPTPTTTHP